MNALKNLLNKKYSESVDDVSYRKAAYYLKNFMCPRGFDVVVSSKEGLMLKEVELTRYMQRTAEYPDLKAGIGYILWDWLLNIRPEDEREFEHEAWHCGETVKNKLAVLREKSTLSLIADAGSTTHVTIRALLDNGPIPLMPRIQRPRNGEPDERETQCRFITPQIITNSLSIATMVAEYKYTGAIRLHLIGGKFSPPLSSISGSMTDQCLLAWGASGTWKCDLAIVGTKGCWPLPVGMLGFASEDADEAYLKATLLKMAFFKVIVMDSSKLKGNPAGNVFAPVSSAEIDLVVIDDGHLTNATKEVLEFSEKSSRAGVGMLVLKSHSHNSPPPVNP